MLDTPPRRRVPAEIAQRRQALAVLLPIHERVGPWQARAARIVACAEKLHHAGGYNPGLVAEAEALHSAVSLQRKALVDTTRQLPPDVAANSRFFAAARALKSIADNLERALALMHVAVGTTKPH